MASIDDMRYVVYWRTDLFERRRRLMEWRAVFLTD